MKEKVVQGVIAGVRITITDGYDMMVYVGY